ncbi:Glycerophosphodiester phosphodiesterase GDPDL7 [Linum grandiflorum]
MRGFLVAILLIHACCCPSTAAGDPQGTWHTLKGLQPKVVAREGFSGLFPESTAIAYNQMAFDGLITLCNLQLTMDGNGICQPDIEISKSTTIQNVYPNEKKTYEINGRKVTGYFTIDYTMQQLMEQVSAMQSIWTRTDLFDGYPLIPFDDKTSGARAIPLLWVNVPYVQFYTEHKLNIQEYINDVGLDFITCLSSPEIGFLKAISAKKPKNLNLYLVFHDKDTIEPTTKKSYGSILSNLGSLKPIVTGIVVPKDYIWPVQQSNYLADKPTSLVADAHKLGLEIYASGFANDNKISYNYSYDPTEEYLNFLIKDQFTVDGFITDFPPTAGDAIQCFAKLGETRPRNGTSGTPLVITRGGASGVYAASSDLAYKQAVEDGADVIDCIVQMSKDGVAFCMVSPDLTEDTTAASVFMDRSTTISEIQKEAGIFSFDLTWDDIQSVQPQLLTQFEKRTGKKRNPAFRNKGKFVSLDDFLEFAKANKVPGVLINLQNAAYLASKKGLDLVAAVTTALKKAQYDKKNDTLLLIQSEDTSVLSKFKTVGSANIKRVFTVKEEVSDVPKETAKEITKYADAVALNRYSIITTNAQGMTMDKTKTVQSLHDAGLDVFVYTLINEYYSLAFDYYSDPIIEIATFAHTIGVDAIFVEFPRTAVMYLRNPCSDLKDLNRNYTIVPIEPGTLAKAAPIAPQTEAPRPALTDKDVIDPPLPKVINTSPPAPPAAAAPPKASSATKNHNLGRLHYSTATALGLLAAGFCYF